MTTLAYPFATLLATGEFVYHRTSSEALAHARRLRKLENKNRVWYWDSESLAWNVRRIG